VFRNSYDDLTSFGTPTLSFESSPPPERLVATIPWANGIKGTTGGLEIAPQWKAASWLELKGSYSYLNMDLSNKSGNTDTATVQTDEGSSPRHQIVLQSLFKLRDGFDFDPTYRYVSALPAQSAKSYSTMDVRLGWQFAEQFDLSVVGQNLFQAHHGEFASGIPNQPDLGIRRSAYLKIVWKR
jgi:iron complex outermembrane receptor protein